MNQSTDYQVRPIDKVSTGVAGLDEVMHGGFPAARTTLLKGQAGTGKTVLATECFTEALAENILVTPALLVDSPCRKTIYGSLRDHNKVLDALGLK